MNVWYIPLARRDANFHFLWTTQESPKHTHEFKEIEITLTDISSITVTRTGRASIQDVLCHKIKKEMEGKGFDLSGYSITPVRFKVDGEDLI